MFCYECPYVSYDRYVVELSNQAVVPTTPNVFFFGGKHYKVYFCLIAARVVFSNSALFSDVFAVNPMLHVGGTVDKLH